MKLSELENMIREMVREEIGPMISEDEYDQARDAWLDDNPAGNWNEFRRRRGDLSPWYPKSSANRDWRQSPDDWRAGSKRPAAPAAPAASAPDKQALLAQKVKYKDENGQEHEATVKSLLGYAKDHPGRKIAARMYAQFMSKAGNKPREEQVDLGEADAEYDDPYAQTTPTRLATPAGKRAKWTATPSGNIEQKPTRTSSSPAPSTPSPSPTAGQSKLPILQRKITYKMDDGSDGEGTIKSLLSYPADHPGHKAAKAAYMRRETYESPTNEKMCEGEGCLNEKSVPEPYNRKTARKMDRGEIEKRKKIGRNMLANEKTVSKFRKKYGDKWKSYLWASASSAAFRSSGKPNKKK